MKKIVLFKVHYINNAIISEYNKLLSSINENDMCIMFIDNHTNFIRCSEDTSLFNLQINDKTYNAISYNENLHKKMNFPLFSESITNKDFGKILWYNSDYPLYTARKLYPQYDYYWSIEFDVFCNGSSYKPFFDKYDNNNSDLIVSDYRIIDKKSNWYWKRDTEWCYDGIQLYGSLFPVVRLSAKAADFLYEKRLKYAQLFEKEKEKPNTRWLFCELFVPTELSNNGFKCENLDEPYIRYSPDYNLNIERIFEKPDNQLYHPVK